MKDTEDKRDFSRIPAAAIVEIAPTSPQKGEEHVEVESLDISMGGISFSSNRQFEIGSRWQLTLRLDESLRLNPDWNAEAEKRGDFQTVKTLCEIVRVKGSEEIGYDVAARFVSIDKEDAAAVRKFLAEL